MRQDAPRRSLAGKQYFAGHTGVTSASGSSNRLEEHCAIALVNLQRQWPLVGGGTFRLLDYQVPLKARRANVGIGKIDLLGVSDTGQLIIIELKVEGRGRSDAPPAALMEGLRYAAMVEADLEAIADEAEHRFGTRVTREPPLVMLLAPVGWWRQWLDLAPAGNWGPSLARLIAAVAVKTSVAVDCMAMEDVKVTYGLDGQAPRVERVPALHPIVLHAASPIGDALSVPSFDDDVMASYENDTFRTLWRWADQHNAEQLDGGRRRGRPPVLRPEHAALNVLVPPDGRYATEIRKAIEPPQRHNQFASLRSSQALAQTVFGAISAFERLDLLETVTAECGRPAFFADNRGWALSLEHEVDTLGEPRPTSIDVLLSGPNRRVAVECKFTEGKFGTCSRTTLRPGDRGYPEQLCDGSYRIQQERSARCSLTEIGVRYWQHLPRLFAWSSDQDHQPCPFGAVYQLARNALAVAVTPDGEVDWAAGHVLVIYDAGNPAFQPGGRANSQWEAAVAACRVPGLLRRLSWQRLVPYIADCPQLVWLADAMGEKYGIAHGPHQCSLVL